MPTMPEFVEQLLHFRTSARVDFVRDNHDQVTNAIVVPDTPIRLGPVRHVIGTKHRCGVLCGVQPSTPEPVRFLTGLSPLVLHDQLLLRRGYCQTVLLRRGGETLVVGDEIR